jgi:SulP family sulfate permease
VLSLIEVHELRELWRIRRSDFWIAATCLLSVLALGPLRAVLIAFLLSTIDVIRRASNPRTWALQETADGSHFVPADSGTAPAASGLVIYRFGAPLYFANANLFMEEVEKLVTESRTPVKWFVFDAEAIADIDSTGAEALQESLNLLRAHGVTIAMSRANEPIPSLLRKYELLELIGENRLYPTNRHAAAAYRAEQGESVPEAAKRREEAEDE